MDRFALAQVAKLVPLCRLVCLETDCHLKRNAVNDSDYQRWLTLRSLLKSQDHVMSLTSNILRTN